MSFPKRVFHDTISDLSLNYFKLPDAGNLYALINSNREYLRKWLPWLDTCKDISNSIDFINLSLKGYKERSSLSLGVFLQNELIGTIAFHKFDWEINVSSIGYWLAEKYQGNNIMYASCKALIDYGFLELGLEKITISCAALNIKSQKIPQKLGFENTKLIKGKENLYGTLVDHYLFEISCDKWSK